MTVLVGAVVLVVVTTASALVFDFSTALGSSDDLPVVRIAQYGDESATVTSGTSSGSTGTKAGSRTGSAAKVDSPKSDTNEDRDSSRWSPSDGTTRTFVPEEVWIRRGEHTRDSEDRRDSYKDFHDRHDRRDR